MRTNEESYVAGGGHKRTSLVPRSLSDASDGDVGNERRERQGLIDVVGPSGRSLEETDLVTSVDGDADHSTIYFTDSTDNVGTRCSCKSKAVTGAAVIIFAFTACLVTENERIRLYLQRTRRGGYSGSKPRMPSHGNYKHNENEHKTYPAFPAKALLGFSSLENAKITPGSSSVPLQNVETTAPYDPLNDFQYGHNRTLLYWEEVVQAIEQYQSLHNGSDANTTNQTVGTVWSNLSTWGACYPRALPPSKGSSGRRLRGHSYRSSPPTVNRNWTSIVQSNADIIADEESIVYPRYKKDFFHNEDESLGGFCRPGFLIIGQGKCGTSSLYHYLTSHPRVLPASEKQVHYFLYHTHRSLKWYYSHFPGIESFLGRGALMTGEASPGYMPYPSVLEMVVKRLSPSNPEEDGESKGLDVWREEVRSLPKIIAIVREPIDRAVSSYKYNYITPALKRMRSGTALSAGGDPIPGGRNDLYYLTNHMFSLEELARAELQALRRCLKAGGQGERYTRKRYAKYKDSFFYDSIKRRNESNERHLIHLDGACYKDSFSNTIPRVQWKELGKEHPNKILALPDLQLIQSIIGRGAYIFPLEWWYEVFGSSVKDREERIQVVCTEDMADGSVDTMENVTKFLGLPEFDSWSDVTNVGWYNVGGHRGYDTVTQLHDEDGADASDDEDPAIDKARLALSFISDSFMKELVEFYRPYNERLFELIGKRCPWKY
ncbi:hypothetical protein HJC23_002368 [Cyclotella cryptica]|uniref:Sulfotransferase domain-containing protein n=1 Tax=Cyclotella cryptica TaxID=29204 RepID=A0ABD3QSV4_9STRA